MQPMKLLLTSLTSLLLLGLAAPAIAQTTDKPTARPAVKDSPRDRAIKRCKENRGVDCDSREGLREWLREERTITDAERQAAAAGRRHREACAKNPKGGGC
jgi:hypothetical protein